MKILCLLFILGAAAIAPAQNAAADRDATNARLLFEEGQQRLKLGNAGMAKVTFETLIAVYPESSLVPQAKEGVRAAEVQEEQLPLVKSIHFLNFRKVKAQEIVERLRDREARLSVESPCDDRCIVEAENIVNEMLAEKGRTRSRVRAELRTVSAWAIEITFKLVKS
jgi:hypothetical protein